MDIPSIAAAINGLKDAANIVKAMKGLHDQADIQLKVIELQETILDTQSGAIDAQMERTELLQRITALEKEIAEAKGWREEKQRYQLIAPWLGCHVYALKDSAKQDEPPHWICPHCYEDGRKSIL